MIQSMTGYGMAVGSSENYKVTVEIKSLNSKFFELGLKVPRSYMKYENHLRNYLTKELERGKVSVMLNVEVLNLNKRKLNINHALLTSYIADLQKIQTEFNLQPPTLEQVLNLPDVIKEEVSEEDTDEWKLIYDTTLLACKELVKSRKDEGKSLENDFNERLDNIETALAEVEKRAPERIAAVRAKMQQTLEEIKSRVEVDKNRFEQELIFYIERLDINEEIVRLRQHLTYFRQIMGEGGSNGKQLNFIGQEMGREINTIGSKANDATLQRVVVKMKDELEKIKEQTMNIV
jgi:uncharacterized protein (TIGR00255 family)